MKSILTIGSLADVGLLRDHQEDAYGYKPFAKLTERERAKGQLFVVADGVGGQQAGEVASRLAVETILREFYAARVDAVESLRLALLAANQEIYTAAREVGHEKMATTAVCVTIQGQELIVGHVGDSRAYLWHEDQLQRLTVDHSWVAEQMAAGALSADAALSHPYRNLITRSLGNKPEVVPEISRLDTLADGDRVMLCTDGLYDGVSEPQMVAVLRARSSGDACAELVRLANEAGGTDNVTVMVLDIQLVKSEDETYPLSKNGIPIAIVHRQAAVPDDVMALTPSETPELAVVSGEGLIQIAPEQFEPSESAMGEATEQAFLQPGEVSEATSPTDKPDLFISVSEQIVSTAIASVVLPPGACLFYEWECKLSWSLKPAMRGPDRAHSQIALPDGRYVICELIAPYEPSPPRHPSSLEIAVSDGMERQAMVLLPQGYAAQSNNECLEKIRSVIVHDDIGLWSLNLGNTRVCVDVLQVDYYTKQNRHFTGLTVRVRIQEPVAINMVEKGIT